MKITAGTATTERDIAAETDFLNVPWQITDDEGAVLLEGAQAFPLNTASDEVVDFLVRKIETYKQNVALHEGAKELQAGLDNSAQVAGEVSNLVVSD